MLIAINRIESHHFNPVYFFSEDEVYIFTKK